MTKKPTVPITGHVLTVAEAVQAGAYEMLDKVRASLKDYPNAGGDVVVMGEVDRLINMGADMARAEEKITRYDLAIAEYSKLYDWIQTIGNEDARDTIRRAIKNRIKELQAEKRMIV